jgi:hypothetical protein
MHLNQCMLDIPTLSVYAVIGVVVTVNTPAINEAAVMIAANVRVLWLFIISQKMYIESVYLN